MKRRYYLFRGTRKVGKSLASCFEQASISGFASFQEDIKFGEIFLSAIDIALSIPS